MEKEKFEDEDFKKEYESPVIDFFEFELYDNIAASGDYGSDTICGEETW